jgi:hypothetical protein
MKYLLKWLKWLLVLAFGEMETLLKETTRID